MSNASIEAAKRSEVTPTSKILLELDASSRGPVRLDALLGAMGSRVHGIALLFLALPDTLPLPIPSTSTILGVPLVLVALHLVVYGEGSGLPERVERVEVSRALLHRLARYAVPVLRVLESVSRPRLAALLRSDRMLGAVCLYLSLLLLLPIPLMNAPPALCLAAVALGMIQRDGLFVAIGIGGTVAVSTAIGFLADWMKDLLLPLSG